MAGSGLRSLMRLESRVWLGLQSSESLTVAGGSASKLAQAHSFWLKAIKTSPKSLLICDTQGSNTNEPREIERMKPRCFFMT